jgi:hypothetical protein
VLLVYVSYMETDERRRFIDHWFDEVRISRLAESLEFVPAARTRELVCCGGQPHQRGCHFIQRARGDTTTPPVIAVRGLDQWLSWLQTDDVSA